MVKTYKIKLTKAARDRAVKIHKERPECMRIKVVVTQQDIDGGKRASSLNCPVAMAASRATNKTVAVGNYSASTRYEEMNTRWELPRSAERFIKKFDDFQFVKPFTFFLKEGF